MCLIDKRRFDDRGGHGCSNSAYRLQRTTCCNSCAVEDYELNDLYTDPGDLTQSVTLLYDPRSDVPPPCPFCGAREWALVEVEADSDVPESWRWAITCS